MALDTYGDKRDFAKTSEPRRIARAAASLLEAATPALRRDGLTAVVDVDPQSL